MISRLKKAVDASGKTYKQIAALTGVSESSVSRYLSGEQPPPFDFVVKVAEALALSLDELTGNPTGAKHAAENAALEALHASYELRLEDKREHIASLKNRIERMEAAHVAELERMERHHAEEKEKLEKTIADQRKRMDRKNIIILILFGVVVVACCSALYWILDALNGDWGKIRYELYALPAKWSAAVNRIMDWFTL